MDQSFFGLWKGQNCLVFVARGIQAENGGPPREGKGEVPQPACLTPSWGIHKTNNSVPSQMFSV